MKRITLLLCTIIIIDMMPACQSYPVSEEVLNETSEMLLLKSTSIETNSICDPMIFHLKSNGLEMGQIEVANSASQIIIQVIPDPDYSISKVDLWIDDELKLMPLNSSGNPISGKFKYHLIDQPEYLISVNIDDITSSHYPLWEGRPLYISSFIKVKNKNNNEELSAWTANSTSGNWDARSYFEFSCCHPVGGGGCFPHTAFGGEKIKNNTYFNNGTSELQTITADNGDVAGTAFIKDGKILCNFDQSWMFYGEENEIVVTGFYDPGVNGQLLYSGKSIRNNEFPYYYGSPALSYYPYYSIELKIQYCTTGSW